MNCKQGDLALVVRATRPENLMKIVEVIGPYDPRECGIVLSVDSKKVWLCESRGSPLVWANAWGFGETHSHRGPIPDEYLRPIRPSGELEDAVDKVECTPPTVVADKQRAVA